MDPKNSVITRLQYTTKSEKCNRVKHAAKMFNAENAVRQNICLKWEDKDQKKEVLMVIRKNRDLLGAGCVRDNDGALAAQTL